MINVGYRSSTQPTGELTLFLNHVGEDISFRHNGFTQIAGTQAISVCKSISDVASGEGCFTKGNSSEVSTFQIDAIHTNFYQVGTFKVDSLETGVSNSSTAQVGTTEVRIIELDFLQQDIKQVGTSEVSITQVNASQTGSVQISPTQVNVTQVDSLQISTSQADSRKISLAGSVSFQQFFSIHNSALTSM